MIVVITKALGELIIKDYENSIPINDLSKKYNVGRDRITKYLKDNNVKSIRSRKSEVLRELYDEAIPYYLKHMSINKTCEKFNIRTKKSFVEHLNKNGIEVINYQNLPRFNVDVFDKIDSEESAYWLGFLYADGYVNKDRNRIELGLRASDKEHLEKFKRFTSCTNKITYKKGKLGDSFRIGMSNSKLISDLYRLGCENCKSLTLKFPSYEQVPKEHMLPFMRGYFDGDGYLGIREILRLRDENIRLTPRCSIVGTLEFITGFNRELGFEFNQPSLSRAGKAYQYAYRTDENWTMIDLFYKESTIHLDSKYEKYINLKHNQKNLPSL